VAVVDGYCESAYSRLFALEWNRSDSRAGARAVEEPREKKLLDIDDPGDFIQAISGAGGSLYATVSTLLADLCPVTRRLRQRWPRW
jgi:hypothetical protein